MALMRVLIFLSRVLTC